MNLSELTQEQAPIDQAIASALVASTPESWRSASMLVEHVNDEGSARFRVEVVSPEGHRDLVSPSEDLFDEIKKLVDLYQRSGKMWTSVTYMVSLRNDGSWTYEADFRYPAHTM